MFIFSHWILESKKFSIVTSPRSANSLRRYSRSLSVLFLVWLGPMKWRSMDPIERFLLVQASGRSDTDEREVGSCGDTELRRWHRLRRSRCRCRRSRSQNFRSRCRSRKNFFFGIGAGVGVEKEKISESESVFGGKKVASAGPYILPALILGEDERTFQSDRPRPVCRPSACSVDNDRWDWRRSTAWTDTQREICPSLAVDRREHDWFPSRISVSLESVGWNIHWRSSILHWRIDWRRWRTELSQWYGRVDTRRADLPVLSSVRRSSERDSDRNDSEI